MTWSTKDIPDLKGRAAVVTGTHTGLATVRAHPAGAR